MMCYGSKEDTFPLTKRECEYIEILCNERISEMETDLENKDSHKFILIKELSSKMNAIVKLMDRKVTENNKKEEEYQTRKHLDSVCEVNN